ncbi:hypothetical protein D9758_013627 [Tetrapyrgos nigripes]|uniref:Uncharacterized protein n=1 Tax=Tetrapyrgos nigripes TaxID=182062 RepID=A0A8H5CPC6_9AGAR|nr:hypothetical protein D9758_013627 [Tetrapyrgos nigripes]
MLMLELQAISSIQMPTQLSAADTITSFPLDPLQKWTRPRRLINTCTLKLMEFPSDHSGPLYCILSHRWDEDKEISYRGDAGIISCWAR